MSPQSNRQTSYVANVARVTGGSKTAVAFAYHNPQLLAPQTLKNIVDAARRLGYNLTSPDDKPMSVRSSGVVGILVPESIATVYGNPFYTSFFEGVAHICEPNGLSIQIISPIAGSLARAVTNAQIDGLIAIGMDEQREELDIVRKRDIPYVIVDGDALDVPSVNVDDETGAWRAADYLLRLGHQRILCMSFEQDFTPEGKQIFGVHKRRMDGFRRAFIDHGMELSHDQILGTPTNVGASMEHFLSYWDQTDAELRPTAILAISDAIALGVLDGARRRGIGIPEDLSIIGFDDIPVAALTHPALTTVRQPVVEKGEAAVKLLLDWVGGTLTRPQKMLLSTTLVIRQSVHQLPTTSISGN